MHGKLFIKDDFFLSFLRNSYKFVHCAIYEYNYLNMMKVNIFRHTVPVLDFAKPYEKSNYDFFVYLFEILVVFYYVLEYFEQTTKRSSIFLVHILELTKELSCKAGPIFQVSIKKERKK